MHPWNLISGHVVLGVPSHHGRCDHPQMDQHRPYEVWWWCRLWYNAIDENIMTCLLNVITNVAIFRWDSPGGVTYEYPAGIQVISQFVPIDRNCIDTLDPQPSTFRQLAGSWSSLPQWSRFFTRCGLFIGSNCLYTILTPIITIT